MTATENGQTIKLEPQRCHCWWGGAREDHPYYCLTHVGMEASGRTFSGDETDVTVATGSRYLQPGNYDHDELRRVGRHHTRVVQVQAMDPDTDLTMLVDLPAAQARALAA